MKCRIFRKSAAFFIIFLCALALCAPARGATLASILDDFAKYQTDPLSRAEELRKEIRRIQETEEGFARQYGSSRTRARCGTPSCSTTDA